MLLYQLKNPGETRDYLILKLTICDHSDNSLVIIDEIDATHLEFSLQCDIKTVILLDYIIIERFQKSLVIVRYLQLHEFP